MQHIFSDEEFESFKNKDMKILQLRSKIDDFCEDFAIKSEEGCYRIGNNSRKDCKGCKLGNLCLYEFKLNYKST